MEEHPHIIERVHLYLQPKSLCTDRAENISRAAMNVGEKLNLLDTWSRIWLNIEVDSLNYVGMLLHYGLNFESFF